MNLIFLLVQSVRSTHCRIGGPSQGMSQARYGPAPVMTMPQPAKGAAPEGDLTQRLPEMDKGPRLTAPPHPLCPRFQFCRRSTGVDATNATASTISAGPRHWCRRKARRHRHTTRSGAGLPSKKAVRFSRAFMPIASRVSVVALPRWGSRTTFSRARRPRGTAGSSA